MERHFESELKSLKELILNMGGYVEKSIEQACAAIANRDVGRFEYVHQHEKSINEAHKAVDRQCLQVLARQAPVAADLRLILVVVKINSDLERMGDQACNIAHNGRDYLAREPIHTKTDLLAMANLVKQMVRESLDAFVRRDTELSQLVLEKDDEVDEAKNEMFNELKEYMKDHPDQIDSCLDLILIARNLERLGDHATNIAEQVIFLATGDDIRHGNNLTPRSPNP